MKGAQRNQARAHTVDENIRIFFRSAATSSTVHAVNTHIPIDVAVLIAKVGAISSATTCVSFTGKIIANYYNANSLKWIKFMILINFLQVSGMNQVKYAKQPDPIPNTPAHSHLLDVYNTKYIPINTPKISLKPIATVFIERWSRP